MKKNDLLLSIGIGIVAGAGTALMMRPKKQNMKSAVGRTLKAMGDVADSISENMGW